MYQLTYLRKILLTLISLLLVVSLSACNKSNTNSNKTDLVMGLTLEPTGLDPTVGSGSSISEVVLYNIFETLTQVDENGKLQPLLASKWSKSADNKEFQFTLLPNVTFHNGVQLTADIVKFSFERHKNITSKDSETFNNIESVTVIDPTNIRVKLKQPQPLFPELMAQGTAIIVEPSSADNNVTNPIGTGPFEFVDWQKGSNIQLKKYANYRDKDIALSKVTIRFINDSAIAVNAVLANDIDYFPRGIPAESSEIFNNNPNYQLLIGNSSAKTIVAINHQRTPLNDVRVRRALSMAVNRDELIKNVSNGYGKPIGSHYTDNVIGYIDTTDINAYNPEKARELLKQAKVKLPLNLSLKLPPTYYARQGGELIAQQLKQVGVNVKIEYIEWARWLDEVYSKKNYDLTIISHVERHDFAKPGSKNYYFNYKGDEFNRLLTQSNFAENEQQRLQYLAKAQQQLANDAVSIYLYNPQWLSVANTKLKNPPKDFPTFSNKLAQISWQD